MDAEMEAAIVLLVEARRTDERIAALNYAPDPAEIGHEIQDKVAARLGEPIGGFKANAPPGAPAIRGAIFARMIYGSPARIAAALVPDLAVEGEIAFRFLRGLPARDTDYTRAEVTEAVIALAAIEVVSGRLIDWRSRPAGEQLADCLNNGALVTGGEVADWQHLDIANLPVAAFVNGERILQQLGGHPTGDPLGVAVALANIERRNSGVKAGQIVTTGSCIGIRSLQSGDRFTVTFEGLGSAELVFAPQ